MTIFKISFDKSYSLLATCQECGYLFIKENNNQKYCSSECSKLVFNEQVRLNMYEYRKKLEGNNKKDLGTSSLGSHALNNINDEHRVIRNEMKRLGLKDGYNYEALEL